MALDQKSVLGKVRSILDAFKAGDELSLADLSRASGVSKGTVHRLAGDLVEWGLLERIPTGYRLGSELFALGHRVASQRRLRDVALPYLQDLYEVSHETIHLGILDDGEVLYIEKIMGHRRVDIPTRVAGRMPLYCTALGKVLMAFSDPALVSKVLSSKLPARTGLTIVSPRLLLEQLESARRAGVGYEREESSLGVACAAAPVMGKDGTPIAALSIAGPVTRFEPRKYANLLRQTAQRLANELDYSIPK